MESEQRRQKQTYEIKYFHTKTKGLNCHVYERGMLRMATYKSNYV